VEIFDGFQERKEIFLILELMNGNLRDPILKMSDLKTILLHISKALKSIHSKGFVHFDIRPGKFD
jgi:serine/threonine protein kinase